MNAAVLAQRAEVGGDAVDGFFVAQRGRGGPHRLARRVVGVCASRPCDEGLQLLHDVPVGQSRDARGAELAVAFTRSAVTHGARLEQALAVVLRMDGGHAEHGSDEPRNLQLTQRRHAANPGLHGKTVDTPIYLPAASAAGR